LRVQSPASAVHASRAAGPPRERVLPAVDRHSRQSRPQLQGSLSPRRIDMKRLTIASVILTLLGHAALAPADSKIKVVATIPDLADMARHIGGDLVEVSSIATGVENIHAVPMKPSFATLLNQTDVLLLLGLEAEHAFLPALLDAAIARWEKEAAPLKGKKLASYHPDLIYFAERFGMEAFGTIELRAGIPPTPSHIEELEESMRKNKVDIVVRELHYPAGLAETVAQATGAKLVELPAFVGGVPQAKDYISFVDYNLHTMLKAVQSS